VSMTTREAKTVSAVSNRVIQDEGQPIRTGCGRVSPNTVIEARRVDDYSVGELRR